MSALVTGTLGAPAQAIYRRALQLLTDADVPFLLGGAYAYAHYTGVVRHTKDLDLFLRRSDVDRARAAFEAHDFRTEVTYPHWLAKAFAGDHFVDLIFNLGNGVGPVDDDWFAHAEPGELLGVPVKLLGPAEMVFSKVFTMDRGRFDGAEVADILREGGVSVLDGDAVEVRGVGIGGAKGFLGGFGRGTLEAWGEPAVKAVVQATMDEVLKLEKALARLRTPHRVALLHYAPIRATVEGEPVEIHAFMGCGRFEEPLNRYGVHAVFHGHAHRGAGEGRTTAGIPVYNVALPLLRRERPDGPAVRVIELAGATAGSSPTAAAPAARE